MSIEHLDKSEITLEECRARSEVLARRKYALEAELARLVERKQELERIAFHNPDTYLPVRRVFENSLDRLLTERAQSGEPFAVGIVRLDESYNKIRNTRDRSKALLFRTGERLKNVLGEQVYQSDRLDEFLVLFLEAGDDQAVMETVRRMIDRVGQSHEGPASDIMFGCAVGLSFFPNHGDSREHLLGNADIALSLAVSRREEVVVFVDAMGKDFHDRGELENEFLKAVREGLDGFEIHFQPFVDQDRFIHGSEALVRWTHAKLGYISPLKFIRIAEETGEILTLGQWILYSSCKQLKSWLDMGYEGLYVSVNLAPHQFKQRDLVKRITGVLKANDLPGSALKLEITEGTIMEDPTGSIAKMAELRQAGVRISIDDFGTGYSSLGYLNKFPIDVLKIDKSFIDGLPDNRHNSAITRAIIAMADSLELETLAEGVEKKEQLDFLFTHGCRYIQGFYFSKAVPASVFETYLKQDRRFIK
jgi:EAL domain-containing protein (putative c-di-GMP-specific phosphodiesterase class I)/GGDEF domain-containing protein